MPVEPGTVLVHLQEVFDLLVAETDPLALVGPNPLYLAVVDEPGVVKDMADLQVVIVPHEIVPLVHINS